MRRFTLVVSLLLATLLGGVFRLVSAAELQTDLREFVSLVPRRRVAIIAARHFILDQHFRDALDYMRGEKFSETWREIRAAPEFTEVVAYLTTSTVSGYDVTSIIDKVPDRLRNFRLPANVSLEAMMVQRQLSTFLREVVRALPRARISSLIARKLKERGDFAKLYMAVRKPEFRAMVDKARSSMNLAAPIQQLIKHSIDVDDLIDIAFTVLKWGP